MMHIIQELLFRWVVWPVGLVFFFFLSVFDSVCVTCIFVEVKIKNKHNCLILSHLTHFNKILTKQYVLCISTNFQRLIDEFINDAVIYKPFWLAALTCKSRTVFSCCSFSPLFFSVRTILYNNHCLSWYCTWVAASLRCLKYKKTQKQITIIPNFL